MAGNNKGNQANIYVFELGMITQSDTAGLAIDPTLAAPPRVQSLVLHSLAVAPSDIRYQDASRTQLRQTVGGVAATKGGRALQQVSLTGVFGVTNRALGATVGTGEQRFQRLWHEVVRLSDAVTKDQIRRERQGLVSPLLRNVVSAFDPDRSSFYVNFYDFWFKQSFECVINSFSPRRGARGAGATGLTSYTMSLTEVGPLVTGGVGSAAMATLFNALGTWSTINEALESFTVEAFVDGLTATANLPLTAMASSVSAFRAQINGATALLNGYTPTLQTVGTLDTRALLAPTTPDTGEVETTNPDPANGTTTLQDHMGQATVVAGHARDLVEALLATRPTAVFSSAGEVDWAGLTGEGSVLALDIADRLAEAETMLAAAQFQPAVGSLYGMSREDYAAFLSGSGAGGRSPALASTVDHVVRPWDTAARLEETYGVTFDQILRHNHLLPTEALTVGRVLHVPQLRGGPPTGIEGLPVFGSQVGREAWGRDLFVDLAVDTSGRLLICGPGTPGADDDAQILVQGVDWIVAEFGEDVRAAANQVPSSVRPELYAEQLAQILRSDRRIESVESVAATLGPGGTSMDLTVTLTAINGGTLTVGVA